MILQNDKISKTFFRPGSTWKENMMRPELLDLFFQVHLKVREAPELAHHSINCLVQLSSLNGGVLANKEDRVTYLSNYLRQFLSLVNTLKSTGSIKPSEALGKLELYLTTWSPLHVVTTFCIIPTWFCAAIARGKNTC